MELITQKREIFEKKVEELRKQGFIPAELYGHGFENLHLSVPAKDFSRVFKEAGESAIIKLKVEENEINVLIHDIQKNHLTDEISHIDFYQVRMDEKIRTHVPLKFIGEAPAVKEKNGVLIKAIHEVEVEALPVDLPRDIPINLEILVALGQNIHIKDIKISGKIKVLIEPETVVAAVIESTKEEEKAEEKEVKVEDIKVEGEEKKEEREKKKDEA